MTNEQQRSPIFRLDKLKKHLYNTIWGIKQLLTNALQIVNVDGYKIRERIMQLGKYAEDAMQLELKGNRLAWTSDHLTGPNDESYTTVTAHYISDSWKMKSACLDFKVFHGSPSGANIYEDIMSVLAKYNGKTMMVMDTVGVTDTTGNMGKLGFFVTMVTSTLTALIITST